jgi:hypothetical protein
MTFAQFNAAIRAAVWPDGEPENLVANHKNYILDALIDLQIKVPRLQQNHTDFILPESTIYSCGASIFDVPRGFIVGLDVLRGTPTNCCDSAPYREASKNELDCLLRDASTSWPCGGEQHAYPFYQLYGEGEYIPYPTLPYCAEYPDQSLDSVCAPTSGYMALFRGQLWVYPHIQSGHVGKLTWDGIKRSFEDTDVIDETLWDREVAECIELYVRGRAAEIDDCDYTRGILFNNENSQRPGRYQVRRADLIWSTEREKQLPKRNYCFSC